MSNLKDRIILSFYEDDKMDLILSEILNNITTKRNRGNRVKDILIEYFRNKLPEDFRRAEDIVNGVESISPAKEKKEEPIHSSGWDFD